MRSSGDGSYIYNMSVANITLNTDYTLIVYPFGIGSPTQYLAHVIQPRSRARLGGERVSRGAQTRSPHWLRRPAQPTGEIAGTGLRAMLRAGAGCD